MDDQGDFLYDYCMAGEDTMTIQTYYEGLTNAEIQALTVHVDNPNCTVSIQDGVVALTCPKGSNTILTVGLEGTDLSDTIRPPPPPSPGAFKPECVCWMRRCIPDISTT